MQTQNITIDTGEVRIVVNEDPDRSVTFNPTDVNFVDRFFGLIGDFEQTLKGYQVRADSLAVDKPKEAKDLTPEFVQERTKLIRETCEFIRSQIDAIFGEGTSKTVFGDAYSIAAFGQFFAQITPYVKAARSKKVAAHTTIPTGRKRHGKKVMQ